MTRFIVEMVQGGRLACLDTTQNTTMSSMFDIVDMLNKLVEENERYNDLLSEIYSQIIICDSTNKEVLRKLRPEVTESWKKE